MKKFIIIFLLISACSTNNNRSDNNVIDIRYLDNMSIEEFKIKLIEYSNNSSYPNIDN